MNKTIFLTGVIFGLLGVVLGAFGAHGLEKLVDADAVATFETGVKYQMYHALFLLILGSAQQLPERSKKWPYYLVVTGVILFSGSIYGLALNSIIPAFEFKKIAFLTPIGGTLLMAGWVLLGFESYKNFRSAKGN
jgi:uncharacterized membrane protein YgdD (TMEM256/DUF423 family)